MIDEVIFRRGNVLVRRQRIEPGEALPWHTDPFHRVAVVLGGDVLLIEFRGGRRPQRVELRPGLATWDEPTKEVHRAVNVGSQAYEEITVFFLDHPEAIPQPPAMPGVGPAR